LALVGVLLTSPVLVDVALADDADLEASVEETAAVEEASESSASSGGSESTSTADAMAAPAKPSKLQVHGFLTQAYATANFVKRDPSVDTGPTFDELALGIPEDGTFEYWNVALQFRYQITPKDVMVVQFSSRRLGDSTISDLEDEVELDWAFYERRLTDNTTLKVGRVQIPLGIFNEIRDVGTILPFYRPAFSFYREGSFTSETVDGLTLSHTFWPESDWSLEADFWIGNWHQVELAPFLQGQAVETDEEGFGFQFWLNTPVPGLRLGLGAHERDTSAGLDGFNRPEGGETHFEDYYFSLEGIFDRWVIRSEYRNFENDPGPFPAFMAGDFVAETEFFYVQLGFHFTEQLRLYVQSEYNDTTSSASIFTGSLTTRFREDTGIALNYLIRPDLVFKVEYHEVDGEDTGLVPVFTPQGVLLDLFNVPQGTGDYAIVSLSASF
jgi:hypothetical protein